MVAAMDNGYLLKDIERKKSEELLRRADQSIINMQKELERLRKIAEMYRERRTGEKGE